MNKKCNIDDIFNGTWKSTPEQDAAHDLKLKSLYRFHKAEINQEVKEIFTFAADLLEKQGALGRGKFFDLSSKPCIVCVHGAIACSSDTIRNLIDDGIENFPAGIWGSANIIDHPEVMGTLTPEEYLYGHYHSIGVAHYRAMQAGLTFEFNDGSTLEEVVGKLRKMANG